MTSTNLDTPLDLRNKILELYIVVERLNNIVGDDDNFRYTMHSSEQLTRFSRPRKNLPKILERNEVIIMEARYLKG
jgi:hypothetical protein